MYTQKKHFLVFVYLENHNFKHFSPFWIEHNDDSARGTPFSKNLAKHVVDSHALNSKFIDSFG